MINIFSIMNFKKNKVVTLPKLDVDELLFFRDRLREARYGALADAEGFQQMCFAFEALGARLLNDSGSLEKYRPFLCVFVVENLPTGYEDFGVLFEAVKVARNDVMHTGAYARNAAIAAVQLSLLMEEAILALLAKKKEDKTARIKVADLMVRSPVTAEPWHTVGHVRRLMLLNSFSYLPIYWDSKWQLISDMAMASMFQPLSNANRNLLAAARISDILDRKLTQFKLQAAVIVEPVLEVDKLLKCEQHPGLWLVVNAKSGEGSKQLLGVLSPFELM